MKKLIEAKILAVLTSISFAGAMFAMQAEEIAVIGWGSLIWNSAPEGRTALKAGAFQQGGPVLPLSFGRVSGNGALTLVIDPQSSAQNRHPQPAAGRDVTTWYAISHYNYNELNAALKNLREREGSPVPQEGKPNPIGYVNLKTKKFRITQISPTTGTPVTIKGTIRTASTNSATVDIVEGSGIRAELLPYLKRIIAWTAHKGYKASIWTDLQRNFEAKTGQPLTQANAGTYIRGLQGDQARTAREYISNTPANVLQGTRDGHFLRTIVQ